MYNFKSLVGCFGTTQTRLCPSGYIMINDTIYDAVIRNGSSIAEGQVVEVIDAVCFSLVVRVYSKRTVN